MKRLVRGEPLKYVVNENIDPFLPGDVTWYPSVEALLRHFEPWFAHEPHLVIDTNFDTYQLESGSSATLVLQPFSLSDNSTRLISLIEAANLPTNVRSEFLDKE